jgi:hypothetical protein
MAEKSEHKTVFLPKQKVRAGFTHGYQSAHGTKVVAVDPNAKPKGKPKIVTS